MFMIHEGIGSKCWVLTVCLDLAVHEGPAVPGMVLAVAIL